MRRISIPILLLLLAIGPAAGPVGPTGGRVVWDPATLVMVGAGGYGRMVRDGHSILCSFEHGRRIKLRRSDDEGKTWSAEVDAGGYDGGQAANPEMLVTHAGTVLLFFNGRPRTDGKRFTIEMASSQDHGRTWTAAAKSIFTAGNGNKDGCYEPSAIQQADGEIELFFANEFAHAGTGDQEISICKSADNGKTWTVPTAACFRPHGRDGMPVPLRPAGGRTIIAIEDNGNGHPLQPAIVQSPSATGWTGPAVDGASERRWAAAEIDAKTYAGAPYVRQMPDGTTVLSCQPNIGHRGQRMTVYVGTKDAKTFTGGTEPFVVDEGKEALWGSIFVKNQTTLTAVSTTTIHGVSGIWAIDGKIRQD